MINISIIFYKIEYSITINQPWIIIYLNILSAFLDYQTLYAAIQVNKYWYQASQNQLNISHQTNIILPILHNSAIHDDFIDGLYKIYYDYLTLKDIDIHRFLSNLNTSYDCGYGSDKFIMLFNGSDKIAPLFIHVINNLLIIEKQSKPIHAHIIGIHSHNNISLFKKGFIILVYFKSLLDTVYYRKSCQFSYDYPKNIFIVWDINLLQDKIFNK